MSDAWSDEAAEWFLAMAPDEGVGFNHLAADVALDLLGPVDDRDVLDVGAGEGTLARRLVDGGGRVVATEPSRPLREAIERDRVDARLRVCADAAEELRTIGNESVDAALYVLVLHHVLELDRALAEAHRVLRPGGRLVVIVPHPWSDHDGAEWIAAADADARLIVADYLSEGPTRSGAPGSVHALGWHHRTLATWLTSLAGAGFVIERVVEPAGDEPRRADGGGHWRRMPRFLGVAARRGAPHPTS